jgi:hypothetical protein
MKFNTTVLIKTKDITIHAHKSIAIVEISEGVVISYKSGHEVFKRF